MTSPTRLCCSKKGGVGGGAKETAYLLAFTVNLFKIFPSPPLLSLLSAGLCSRGSGAATGVGRGSSQRKLTAPLPSTFLQKRLHEQPVRKPAASARVVVFADRGTKRRKSDF